MKLKAAKLEFYIDFGEAMSAECERTFSRPHMDEESRMEAVKKAQESFEQEFPDGFLIQVNVVIGDWRDPDGFLLRIGDDTHLILMGELREEPRDKYIGTPTDLADLPPWIVFHYLGSDSTLLNDIVKNYKDLRFEGKSLF